MAIIDTIPGLEVQILLDKQPAIEYTDEDSIQPEKKTVYIQAESGKQFDIRCRLGRNFDYDSHDVNISICIDGKKVSGRVKHRKSRKRSAESLISGHRYRDADQSCKIQQFRFADLHIADEMPRDIGALEESHLNDLGTIKVTITRVDILDYSTSTKRAIPNELATVTEKDIKGHGLKQHVHFSEPTSIKRVKSRNVKDIDPKNKPRATFIFKYRSNTHLKYLCLIPRTPSPIPVEERRIEDLTVEELRVIAQQQRDQKIAERRLKQESEVPSLKREHTGSPEVLYQSSCNKKARTSLKKGTNEEPIDLTDD